MTRPTYRLIVGYRSYSIIDQSGEIVWNTHRTGMRSYRAAQAKLRDFKTAERIRRLAELFERKQVPS